MKPIFRFIFLMLMMSSVLKHAFAQQAVAGYVINQKNDTVKCWILHQGAAATKYEALNKDEFIKITTDSVKEYKSQDMQYPEVSVRLKPGKKNEFLARLVKGAIGLYELRKEIYYNNYGSGGISRTNLSVTWYAAKNNTDTLYDIASGDSYNPGKGKSEQKAHFLALIANNTYLAERINQRDENDFETIKKVVEEYNSYYSPAQDYFVTQKNDTIKCSLGLPSTTYRHNNSVYDRSYTLAYRLPNKKDFIPLNVDSVSEYAFKDSVLIKFKLPNTSTTKFMSWMVRGKINLYVYGPTDDAGYYYASKNDAPLVEIKLGGAETLKQRLQVLSNLIADDTSLLEQLKNTTVLNHQVIYYAIKAYNQFKN